MTLALEWTPATSEGLLAELRVARLVAEGLTNRAVAKRLSISPHTVDSHLRHVFAKRGISSRVALARLALIHDHIRADEPSVH